MKEVTKRLILTRKLGESIVIGDGLISIRPVQFKGTSKVVIQVDAPADIRVDRFEVHQKRTQEVQHAHD